MNKTIQFFWVCVLMSLAFVGQADSDSNQVKTNNRINHNWSKLTQEQYVDNLVECKITLDELKWSYNLWPKENKSPKPLFSEVVDIDEIRQSVLENLKMEAVLAKRFNFEITPAMLQHDLDRMARQTKDSKRLKELFAVLDNDATTIAQCVSRPYLVQKKLANQFNYNSTIHAEVKQKAQSELNNYLKSKNSDDATAQVHTVTYALVSDDIKSLNSQLSREEINKERVIELDAEKFENILKKSINKYLQEQETSFVYAEIIKQTKQRIKIKVQRWEKLSQTKWLSTQLDTTFLPASITNKYSLPKIIEKRQPLNNKAAVLDRWETDKIFDKRSSHTAIWTGSEMIIWGGSGDSGNLNSGGRYNPVNDSWSQTSIGLNVPTGRNSHTAVWTGIEMIVWGGQTFDGSNSNFEKSGGRYNPINDSWLPTNIGMISSRARHTAVWTGSEMIVWGGDTGADFSHIGYRYDPSADNWSPISVNNAPSDRRSHTAIWTGSEMIIWGGFGDSGNLNSGGRYNPVNDSWSQTSIGLNVPTGRNSHTAVWTGIEMIVWGGAGDGGYLNSGGRYNPVTNSWSSTTVATNVPTARVYFTAIWTGNEMIIWGGRNGQLLLNTGGRYNPNNDSWDSLSNYNIPSNRNGHTAIWTGSEMIIWGGYDGSRRLSTGGRYNPDSDSWIATSTGANIVANMARHTAVWTGNEMVVWGGVDNENNMVNTGFIYNPVSHRFTSTSTGSNAPLARIAHTAIWTGSEMIIWGGIDQTWNRLNTGGRYNPIGDSWISMNINNVPTSREGHSAIWTGSEMVIWGGHDNTGGRYNPFSNSWLPTSVNNAPIGRSNHTAIWIGTEMIVWGGSLSQYDQINTGGRYNPVSDNWSSTNINNAPIGRDGHTAIWTGTEMIVWGGYYFDGGENYLSSGSRYDPINDSWSVISNNNSLTGRRYHTSVWTGKDMIIWGGYGGNYEKSGGLYKLVSDSWSQITSWPNAPTPRSNHTAIWTGSEMIIWGGDFGDNQVYLYYRDFYYDIRGHLNGLQGDQITIQNNGSDDLILTSDGGFTFNTPVLEGTSYDVTVLTGPQNPSQTCTVTNGSGTNITADVEDVYIHCFNSFNVGVTVTGLAAGNTLKLENNGGNLLEVSENNTLTNFTQQVANGEEYLITFATQPTAPNQICSITPGDETGTINSTDVNVDISCVTLQYDIGVTVSGLDSNNSIELTTNAQSLVFNSNTTANFPTPIDDSTAYAVLLTSQPSNPNQVCTISGGNGGNDDGSGVLAGQDVAIFVDCVTVEYSLGGLVSGLANGNVLTMYNNTADEFLLISNNGSYAFLNTLLDGSDFDISVASHPTSPNQTCSIDNAIGSIAGGDITNIDINCVTKQYFVGGYVLGLIPDNHMVLQNNFVDDLIISNEGAFAFSTSLDDLEGYDVTIKNQPDSPIQSCELANNNGTINGQDVESVFIYCEFGDDLIFRHGFDEPEGISRELWEFKDGSFID